MNEETTVDAAISKGHKMVLYPVIIIIIVLIGLTIYLESLKYLPIWGLIAGFILSFIAAWFYWSIIITKWRLWAFENVRNVHELEKRAVQEKLIFRAGSFFEKTEIRNLSDREKWNLLQKKFDKEDEFHDDFTIPNETIIYFSKRTAYIGITVMLCCFGIGIYLLTKTNSYITGTIMSLMGAYFGYQEYKKSKNTEPQIILSNKGIQTISTGFYNWSDIENEEAIIESSGKYSHSYLTYYYPSGFEKLEIEELDTNVKDLNKLLILYRGRNKIKSKH